MQHLFGIWVREVGCWAPVMPREKMKGYNLTGSPIHNTMYGTQLVFYRFLLTEEVNGSLFGKRLISCEIRYFLLFLVN